jgi:hypothetical protein
MTVDKQEGFAFVNTMYVKHELCTNEHCHLFFMGKYASVFLTTNHCSLFADRQKLSKWI